MVLLKESRLLMKTPQFLLQKEMKMESQNLTSKAQVHLFLNAQKKQNQTAPIPSSVERTFIPFLLRETLNQLGIASKRQLWPMTKPRLSMTSHGGISRRQALTSP